jgi:aspartate/methionine/tyrosine aminotransferase
LKNIKNLVTVPRPDGAFYFLLRVHKDVASMELVKQLIEKYKVAVIPGQTFGLEDKCYLRIAYGALQKETAIKGINRLINGLQCILDS